MQRSASTSGKELGDGQLGAIGFYIIASPVAGLASLTLAIALYLLIEGVNLCCGLDSVASMEVSG